MTPTGKHDAEPGEFLARECCNGPMGMFPHPRPVACERVAAGDDGGVVGLESEVKMFDLFGDQEARKALNAQRIHQASVTAAIITLLIQKGIITEDEYHRALAKSTAEIDQYAASQADEVRREFAEKYPDIAKVMEQLGLTK